MSVDPSSRGWNGHRHRLVPDAVQPLPYNAGWVDYASPWGPAGYRVDAAGLVHLQGLVSTNSVTGTDIGSVIATLPVGVRPLVNQAHLVLSFNAATHGSVRLDINTAGQITLLANVAGGAWSPSATSGSVWISLAGISYPAA